MKQTAPRVFKGSHHPLRSIIDSGAAAYAQRSTDTGGLEQTKQLRPCGSELVEAAREDRDAQECGCVALSAWKATTWGGESLRGWMSTGGWPRGALATACGRRASACRSQWPGEQRGGAVAPGIGRWGEPTAAMRRQQNNRMHQTTHRVGKGGSVSQPGIIYSCVAGDPERSTDNPLIPADGTASSLRERACGAGARAWQGARRWTRCAFGMGGHDLGCQVPARVYRPWRLAEGALASRLGEEVVGRPSKGRVFSGAAPLRRGSVGGVSPLQS